MFTQWPNQSQLQQIKRFGVPLSWMIYLLALLLIRPGDQGTLAAAAALPVFFTGWNLGLFYGGLSALFVTLLPFLINLFLTGQTDYLSILSTNQLIRLLLLTTIGMLSGALHDRRYPTKQKYQLLNLTQEQLQRSSALLKIIHRASSWLINTQDWRKVLPGLLKELRIATKASRVYYLDIHQLTDQRLTADFFFSQEKGSPETTPDLPARKVLELEGTNLSSWIAQKENDIAVIGLIDDLHPREKDFLNSAAGGSFAVYPVFCDQEIAGFIGLEKYSQDTDWDKSELDALGMLAQVLGTSLTREAAEQIIKRRSIELDTLHRTGQRTNTEVQLNVALSAILEQLFVLIPAHLASIFIYKQQRFFHLTSTNDEQQTPFPFSQSQEKELMKAAVKEQKPLIIPDCRHHPQFDHLPDPVHKSAAILPLKAATGIVGMLNVWYREARNFNQEEIRLLRMLANQAASAIINIEFYRAEKEQRLLEESLRKASMKLASNLELNQVLENILEQALNLVSAQNAVIFTAQGDELKFSAAKGQNKSMDQTTGRFPAAQEIACSVLNNTERIIHYQPSNREDGLEPATFPRQLKTMGLPLLLSGKILGVMVVNFPEDYQYRERTINILEILADQAVIALNNARLYAEERDHRQLAEALEKTGQIIKSSLNLDTVLDMILAQMENVVPYDTGNLMLVEDGTARVVRHRGYQMLDPEILSRITEISLTVTEFETLQKMISTQEPLIISDTTVDPNWVETQTTSQVLSWMGAPIIQGEEVIGYLSVNKFEKGFYQPEHKRRIAAFASQAAIALQHARLFQSEAARRREAERLRKTQESLLQISRTISFTVEVDQVASRVVSSIMDLLPVDHALILKLSESENKLQPLSYQISESAGKDLSIERLVKFINSAIEEEGSPLVDQLIKNKTTIVINDLQETDLISSQEPRQARIKSMIASPLLAQDKVLGILFAGCSRNYHPFSHYDIQFFTGLADQTAAALERSRLFAEIKQMAVTDPLTGVLNRRGLSQWGGYEFDRAVRFNRSLGMIYFDLDHFKEINDTHGHQTGDLILQNITDRCQKIIRNVDILARVGGEEFLIILPETDQETAFQVAERVRVEINTTPFLVNDQEIKVTISLGVTELSPEINTLEEMISAADQAMYQAKHKGRNRTASR